MVGRSGTGVSTLLNTVARAAKHDGFKSIGISDGSAGLAEVADQWLPLRNLTAEAMTSALESFDDEDRVLVVVDRVSKLSAEASDVLKKWILASSPGAGMVVAGDRPPAVSGIVTGLLKELVSYKTGFLLCPDSASATPFANRIASTLMAPRLVGRAVFFQEGDPVTSVQVAH